MRLKKIIIILMTMIIVLSNTMISNISMAAVKNNELEIKAGEEYSDNIAYKNARLRFVYTYYINEVGKEQPVFCIDKSKTGADRVEGKSYNVTLQEKITDIKIWRILTSSYPYVSISDMGCDNKYQCYSATQAALYCILYDWKVEQYNALNEDGEIIVTSINNLIKRANDSTLNPQTSEIRVIERTDWILEKIDGKIYASKVLSATNPNLINEYTIRLRGDIPAGTLVTGVNNQIKSEFSLDENFKILIPRDTLTKEGTLTIDVYSELPIYPIYKGIPEGDYQPYAITGIKNDDIKDSKSINYNTIGGTLIINKVDKETNAKLADAIFSVYDSSGNTICNKVNTNENGEIKIYNLEEGVYYVEEIEAPEGYEKIEQKHKVEVFNNSTSNVNIMNMKTKSMKEEIHNVVVDIVENNTETTIKTENDYYKKETNNNTETNIEINNTTIEKENNNQIANNVQNNNTTISNNNTLIKNNESNTIKTENNNILTEENSKKENNTTLVEKISKEENNKLQTNINNGKKLPKTGM